MKSFFNYISFIYSYYFNESDWMGQLSVCAHPGPPVDPARPCLEVRPQRMKEWGCEPCEIRKKHSEIRALHLTLGQSHWAWTNTGLTFFFQRGLIKVGSFGDKVADLLFGERKRWKVFWGEKNKHGKSGQKEEKILLLPKQDFRTVCCSKNCLHNFDL